MPIKTFRAKMALFTQDTISLHTNNGSTGYRIKKFEIIPEAPGGSSSVEHVLKIYSVAQTGTPDATVDMSDNTLLAVAYLENRANASSATNIIIFDNMVFNQDIYVTAADTDGAATVPANYYIELEQVKLDLNENTVATLKDIRNQSV